MNINDRIKRLIENCGADFFGVADLSSAYDAILTQGGPMVTNGGRSCRDCIGNALSA